MKKINTKNLSAEVLKSGISKEDMVLINKYSLKELNENEVFVFGVVLCDNEIDRDFERFSTEALEKLGELFLGKTAILNHSGKAEDQTARTFKTQVVMTDKMNSAGEKYAFLKAWAYMLKSEKNADMIKEIEAGIKKETSVSCSVNKSICSICGKNTRKEYCTHKKGSTVEGKLCFSVLTEPTDAYEWSFVAVPAQKNAGVTKSFSDFSGFEAAKLLLNSENTLTLTKTDINFLWDYIENLEKRAEDADVYRKQLEKEVVSLFAVTVPAISSLQAEKICESLSSEMLRTVKKGFEEKKNELLPVFIQTAKEKTDNKNSIGDYLI